MDSREHLQNALNHKQGVIPVDFGSTAVTGMHVKAMAALREHYGLERRLVKVCDPYQMLGEVEEDLKDAIGVDIDGIHAPSTIFGFTNENWKEHKMPWGQEVLVSEHFQTKQNENGDLLIYPQGDTSARPSGRMPQNGYFFDTIIRQDKIDDNNLNAEDNLEEFQPLSDSDLEYYREGIERVKKTGRGVNITVPGLGIGDIALVPAPFLKNPKGIRDITEWYISTAMRQDYLHAVFSKQVEIGIENLQKVYDIAGDAVDVLFVCGTDFGTQTGSFCSPDTFKDLWFPYYKKINDWVHKNTTWKSFKHCCGSIPNFMGLLADCGFDIINPVQISAKGMNPETLKDKFGSRLTFWGGGVDTQKTLPYGKASEVRDEVKRHCEIFSKEGGYVFNTVHNIQANVPAENVVAMIEALNEFRGVSRS